VYNIVRFFKNEYPQTRDGYLMKLIQEGPARPTVEILQLVVNVQDSDDTFEAEALLKKYPNLSNFTMSVEVGSPGTEREMKRFFKVFGKNGRLAKFDLTFFSRLYDDVFLPGIQEFQGMKMPMRICSAFEMVSKVGFRLLLLYCFILALKVLKIECDMKSSITDRIMTDGLHQLSLERFELTGYAFSVSL
jgi:hypothetical protein